MATARKKSEDKGKTTQLRPYGEIGAEKGCKAALVTALARHQGWAPGKLVSEKDFDAALEALNVRPMGGGSN